MALVPFCQSSVAPTGKNNDAGSDSLARCGQIDIDEGSIFGRSAPGVRYRFFPEFDLLRWIGSAGG